MNKTNRPLQFLGTIFVITGTLLSLFLLVVTVWGDLESALFASTLDAEKSLSSLNCPILMSSNEVGKVTATFKNLVDRDWDRFTRVYISDGFITLRREVKMKVPIPEGEKVTVSWDLTSEDAVYNRFIFFHIYVNAKYPYPSLGGSCGVVLLDLWNLTGTQSLILILATSLGLILLGVVLWKISTKSGEKAWYTYRSMIGLAVIIFIGLVVGYIGAWVIALLLLVSALLLSGIIIGRKMSLG